MSQIAPAWRSPQLTPQRKVMDAKTRGEQLSGLLPDPEPREVHYTVISVDDHLIEPADVFEGRMPARFADRAPRVITDEQGNQAWKIEDRIIPQLGFNATAGLARKIDWTYEPASYEEIRPGCYKIKDRIADMDINGVWASLCFPSAVSGFCGAVYSATADPEFGHAAMQAWNNWFYEEWYGPYPERIVPLGLTWLADPLLGAAEIRRNAERGFKAVTLPEQPHRLGYPSLYSGYWDPIVAACHETETVICLHVGSSGSLEVAADAPRPGSTAALFQAQAFQSCVDWLWSGVALRYPGLKIAMSEGGIGWVPMLRDRLEFMMTQSGHGGSGQWPSKTISPSELLTTAFWFCTIDDPSTMPLRHRIGVEHIMVESDYPHTDSSWPDTQLFLAKAFAELSTDEIRKISHENAARLFRHPLPAVRLP